jgi:hypothetical protein
MGGGLFGTHLYLNAKCLVFSAIIIAVYFLPHPPTTAHTIVMIFLLAFSAYVGLAWNDYLFQCKEKLGPTVLGYLSGPFKPPDYSREFNELPEEEKKVVRSVDIAVLGVIVLTFIYPFILRGKK